MPSPFPGMDPFLEDPDVFPDLHDRMITYLCDAIQPRLPEPYYAMTRTRIWLEMAQRPIWPDVNVQRSNGGGHAGPAGGVAVAVCNTPVVVPVQQEEMRQPYVDIYTQEANGGPPGHEH